MAEYNVRGNALYEGFQKSWVLAFKDSVVMLSRK